MCGGFFVLFSIRILIGLHKAFMFLDFAKSLSFSSIKGFYLEQTFTACQVAYLRSDREDWRGILFGNKGHPSVLPFVIMMDI